MFAHLITHFHLQANWKKTQNTKIPIFTKGTNCPPPKPTSLGTSGFATPAMVPERNRAQAPRDDMWRSGGRAWWGWGRMIPSSFMIVAQKKYLAVERQLNLGRFSPMTLWYIKEKTTLTPNTWSIRGSICTWKLFVVLSCLLGWSKRSEPRGIFCQSQS